MDLTEKVKRTIIHHGLFRNGSRILIGVSGGPDSLALANILQQLRHDMGITLYIAHLNHKIRRDSGKDQRFVKKIAQDLGLPFFTANIDVKKLKGSSIEEKAREARFRFLKEVSKKCKANIVALGHTQDDTAETVLMRILRGTGTAGLCTILPKRNINGLNVVRPLIDVSKKDILLFLKKKRLSFCIDKTNMQKKFLRNAIRIDLIPLLEKKYNKNARQLLANLSNVIATDYNFVEEAGKKALKKIKIKGRSNKANIEFSLLSFSKYHLSIQRMIVRLAVQELKGNMNRLTISHAKMIEDLISRSPCGATAHLPNNIIVEKKRSRVLIRRNS